MSHFLHPRKPFSRDLLTLAKSCASGKQYVYTEPLLPQLEKKRIRMILNIKMTKGLRIVLTIALIIIFQQLVKAQANQNQQYLQKIGVLDSLYSEILNESRKVYIQLPASYDPEKNKNTP